MQPRSFKWLVGTQLLELSLRYELVGHWNWELELVLENRHSDGDVGILTTRPNAFSKSSFLFMVESNILLCGYPTFDLFTSWLTFILMYFMVNINSAAMNVWHKFLYQYTVFIFPGQILKSGIAESYDNSFGPFEELAKFSGKVTTPFYIAISSELRILISPHPHQHLFLSLLF